MFDVHAAQPDLLIDHDRTRSNSAWSHRSDDDSTVSTGGLSTRSLWALLIDERHDDDSDDDLAAHMSWDAGGGVAPPDSANTNPRDDQDGSEDRHSKRRRVESHLQAAQASDNEPLAFHAADAEAAGARARGDTGTLSFPDHDVLLDILSEPASAVAPEQQRVQWQSVPRSWQPPQSWHSHQQLLPPAWQQQQQHPHQQHLLSPWQQQQQQQLLQQQQQPHFPWQQEQQLQHAPSVLSNARSTPAASARRGGSDLSSTKSSSGKSSTGSGRRSSSGSSLPADCSALLAAAAANRALADDSGACAHATAAQPRLMYPPKCGKNADKDPCGYFAQLVAALREAGARDAFKPLLGDVERAVGAAPPDHAPAAPAPAPAAADAAAADAVQHEPAPSPMPPRVLPRGRAASTLLRGPGAVVCRVCLHEVVLLARHAQENKTGWLRVRRGLAYFAEQLHGAQTVANALQAPGAVNV